MKYWNPIYIFHVQLTIYRYYNLSNFHKIFTFISFSLIIIESFVKFSTRFVFIRNSVIHIFNDSREELEKKGRGVGKKKKKKKKRRRIYSRNAYHKLIKEILQLTQEKSIPHTKYWFHRGEVEIELQLAKLEPFGSLHSEATGVVTLHFSKYLTEIRRINAALNPCAKLLNQMGLNRNIRAVHWIHFVW